MKTESAKVVHLSGRRNSTMEDVLQKAVRDHETALKRFLRARLAHQPDQEDLVQEIYLRLARQENLAQKLSRGEAATRSYLFSMATNLIRDRYRGVVLHKEDFLPGDKLDQLPNASPSPETVLAARQDMLALKQGILKLNPNCRRAFILSRFQDKSYREIADEMQISVSMVEKHIIRALAEIRQRVNPRTGSEQKSR
jgi:RNA polymerase sigma-70 factor (ECF subfamily)